MSALIARMTPGNLLLSEALVLFLVDRFLHFANSLRLHTGSGPSIRILLALEGTKAGLGAHDLEFRQLEANPELAEAPATGGNNAAMSNEYPEDLQALDGVHVLSPQRHQGSRRQECPRKVCGGRMQCRSNAKLLQLRDVQRKQRGHSGYIQPPPHSCARSSLPAHFRSFQQQDPIHLQKGEFLKPHHA